MRPRAADWFLVAACIAGAVCMFPTTRVWWAFLALIAALIGGLVTH